MEVTGNQLTSVPDPSAPGKYLVVAVGGDGSAPPGCPAGTSEATGYGVAVGTPAGLQSQSAWSSNFAPIACQAFSPVLVGGGPAGGQIGVVESEGAGLAGAGSDGVYYRRFDASTERFLAPVLVSDETGPATGGAGQLSASQDSTGGVYAAWLDHRGTVLDYSSSAGTDWGAPLATGLGIVSDPVIAGVGAGDAVLAYSAAPAAGPPGEYLVGLSYSALAGAH